MSSSYLISDFHTNVNNVLHTLNVGGWMGYAVGTGVATALKVVQRHSPLRVKPEGKKVRIRAVDLVV